MMDKSISQAANDLFLETFAAVTYNEIEARNIWKQFLGGAAVAFTMGSMLLWTPVQQITFLEFITSNAVIWLCFMIHCAVVYNLNQNSMVRLGKVVDAIKQMNTLGYATTFLQTIDEQTKKGK